MPNPKDPGEVARLLALESGIREGMKAGGTLLDVARGLGISQERARLIRDGLLEESGRPARPALALEQYREDLSRPSRERSSKTADITLSEREYQVLLGMSRGLRYATIANELGLTENTIKTHGRRIFAKLRTNDRAHAVSLGYRHGLLDPGPTPDTQHSLSNYAFDVLVEMADGLSDAEIGKKFLLARETIKSRAKKLYLELGVPDRAGAVAEGYRRRLLPLPLDLISQQRIESPGQRLQLSSSDRLYIAARAISGNAAEAAMRVGLDATELNATQVRIANHYRTANVSKQLIGALRDPEVDLKVGVPKGKPEPRALAAMAVLGFSANTARSLAALRIDEEALDELLDNAAETMLLPHDSRQEMILSAYSAGMLNSYLPSHEQMVVTTPFNPSASPRAVEPVSRGLASLAL